MKGAIRPPIRLYGVGWEKNYTYGGGESVANSRPDPY